MSLCPDDGIRKECVFLRLTAETDVLLITASPSAVSVFALQHPLSCMYIVLLRGFRCFDGYKWFKAYVPL